MMVETFPSLFWRTRLFLFVTNVAANLVRLRDNTVNRRLISLIKPCTPANHITVDGISSSDHTVDPVCGLWVRVFSPQKSLPLIVYFHGGGFAFHSPATSAFDTLCRRIARAVPAVVVSIGPILPPETESSTAKTEPASTLHSELGVAILIVAAT